MEGYEYLIVGGGMAGQRAVVGIRKVDSEGTIALVASENHVPYERPPLSKKYLRSEVGLEKVYLKEKDYYAENDVELLLGQQVKRIDPSVNTATLEDGTVLAYEKLLLATGGRARSLPIPGADLPGVFTLRTIEDSDAIQAAARRGSKALVIGGSFIGSEVAASMAQLGVHVTMAFLEERLQGRIAPEALSVYLRNMYEEHGIRLLPATSPKALEGDGSVERARLSNGETLELDFVVTGVGIDLNTELAEEAGLATRDDGGVIVDEYLRSSDEDVYAAGDIAVWPEPTFGHRLRVEHWDVARAQGLRAGRNMAGDEKPYTTLPYFFSDIFDLSFEVWGDLGQWNETVQRGSLEEDSFSFFYFHDGRLVGVLTAGRPEEERAPMQAIVKARPAFDDVADALGDEERPLQAITA